MENMLVQYKGGGYDGCIWEWNYGVFDAEGGFHVIFASGSRGCPTAEEMNDFIAKAGGGPLYLCPMRDYYLYDIQDEEQLREFAQTSNEGHVQGVADYLYNELGVEIVAECSRCGVEYPARDMRPSGLTGAGGIAVQYTELLCVDCLHLEDELY